MPNQQQIEGVIRWLLATGGPLGSILVSRGANADTLNQVTTLAIAVVPPLIALVWSLLRKTDRQTVIAASNVPGAQVQIDHVAASPALIATAQDQSIPNVVSK